MGLVLHIGFPKTGTTTLQQWFAGNCAGRYLGKPASDLSLPDFALFPALRKAVTRPPVWATHEWASSELAVIAEAMATAIDAVGSPIVSDEDLVCVIDRRGRGLPFLDDDRPSIIGLLEAMAREFEIHVLVTIRAQTTWWPSLYAELARQMLNPSQQDFERRMTALLADQSATGWRYADWSRWLVRLHGAVGASNVTCLCVEDMATPRYWESVAAVVGVSSRGVPGEHVNSLGADGSWRLRELAPKTAAQWGASGTRDTITVPGPLADEFRVTYRKSNRILADLLEREFEELECLGY